MVIVTHEKRSARAQSSAGMSLLATTISSCSGTQSLVRTRPWISCSSIVLVCMPKRARYSGSARSVFGNTWQMYMNSWFFRPEPSTRSTPSTQLRYDSPGRPRISSV